MKKIIILFFMFILIVFNVNGLNCDKQELVFLGECIGVSYPEHYFEFWCWKYDLNYDFVINLSDICLYTQECYGGNVNEKNNYININLHG